MQYNGEHERVVPQTWQGLTRSVHVRQVFAFMVRALRESLRDSPEPAQFGYDPFVFTEQTSLDIAEGRCDAPDPDGDY